MTLHLQIIGTLLVALAFVHVIFPAYFKWKEELKPLSLINRQMMYVHTFFIAMTVFLMGIFCLTSANELVDTVLGRRLASGLGFFWFTRLLIQFFGYSPELWKGRQLETIIHLVFSFLWAYLSLVFFAVSAGISL